MYIIYSKIVLNPGKKKTGSLGFLYYELLGVYLGSCHLVFTIHFLFFLFFSLYSLVGMMPLFVVGCHSGN